MKILVDTSVWSLVLRKKKPGNADLFVIDEFKELIRELRVVIIGPIRQEILSGISDVQKFLKLKEHLAFFDDEILSSNYFENAAQYSNLCRSKGVQGSHTDFLICSVANIHNYPIFTLDKDFQIYPKYIDIKLHKMRIDF